MSKFSIALLLWINLNHLQVHGQVFPVCRTYPGSVLGSCILVKDCPRLSAVVGRARGAGSSEAIQILRRSVCASGPLRVCCETITPESLGPSGGVPSTCGTGKRTDRIVGGVDAGSWWPWMVLLVGRSVADGSQQFFCGGTLINAQFVLTAAHCNDSSIIVESARLGELIIGTDPDTINRRTGPSIQDIGVTSFIVHPNYGEGCRKCNDIALLKLASPAKIRTGFVSPICLPLHPAQEIGRPLNNWPGLIATATGWGSDSRDPWNPTKPDHLQEVQLVIDDTSFCQRVTAGHPAGSVICAGAGNGKDTCRGDSGGPLMLSDDTGRKFFLVGISSFGPTVCGSQGTQGIFTNVHQYIQWIEETVA